MLFNSNLGTKKGLTFCLVLALSGCSDSSDSKAGADFNTGITDDDNTSEFDQTRLLTDLTTHVFIPSVQSFESLTADLISNVSDYCQAIEQNSADVATAKTNAQSSWINVMNQWQKIEVMQVGPLTTNDAKLRNAIYSWPVTNQCAVDQDVGHFELGTINDNAYDITRRTVTRRGLDAAEYLLFNDDLNHSCSSDSLAPSLWNQRSESERSIARCNFVSELATDINNSAKELTLAWTSDVTGYQTVLANAGNEGNPFDSAQAAINHITDAMFYIDSVTKDAKLAAPIGLADNSCGNAACVDDIESLLSNNAINNVQNNLVALQSLFLGAPKGTEAQGFDDYLIAVDAQELATTMATDIQAAIDATDAFSGSMTDAVNASPEKVQALHQAVKTVTDNLKSLFITYLSLELPLTSAGDAD